MEQQWEQECADFRGEDLPDAKPYSLAFPGSHCPSCGAEITALQDIPVLSYLFLAGRCANCGVSIPIRYPLIEVITALIWILCGLSFGVSNALAAAMLLTALLISLTAVSYTHLTLPTN